MSVTYYSKSRDSLVDVETMPTPHLSRAAKKLAETIRLNYEGGDNDGGASRELRVYGPNGTGLTPTETLQAMIEELASRVPPKGSA